MYNVPLSRLSTNRVDVVILRHAVAKLIVRQFLLKVSLYVEKRASIPRKYVITRFQSYAILQIAS
ncbi:hypothetical protein J4Q44_G00036830 [Coregonus suidteri]|uniref:Uncharacterized protein n=1 Tax=Coregonus suidteri TaxID=861788 RepID=A0AAN8MDZ1_9TELE